MGWYDNANCTGNAKSTSSSYTVTITASENTASATYYALFRLKPVFEFSATAYKIYDHGSATASVADSRIVGAVGDTQKSTTATFEAEPYPGCTFMGWYYDEAHTELASTATTYTKTITNSQSGSTASLTLYAWFKSNQTLTWTNPDLVNIVNGTTETGAAAATAESADSGTATGLTVTYESNHTEIATVNSSGDVTGVSASATAVTITATQAGNDEYNPVSATRQFYVVNKIEAEFTPSGFSVSDLITLYVGATPTITLTGVDTDFSCIPSNAEVVSWTRSGNVITLTANQVGTADVTLTQPNNATHSAVSTTYHFTVEKVPNTLAVSLAAQSAQVDGTIAVTFTDKNNTATPILGTITNQTLSSSEYNGTDVITYANGVITAKNAGTAMITFTQAATDKYTAFTSSTYEITVTKISNPITITLAGGSSTNIKLKYGATASLSYTSINTGSTPIVSRIEGNYTSYSNGTITAGNVQGADVYSITQAETYKYEAGYASFTIRVNNSDEKDGYVLYDEAEENHTPISTSGTYFNEHTLTGPGEILSFKAHRSAAGVSKLEVQCYVNGSWQTGDNAAMYTEDLPTSYGSDITCKIPEGTTKIRFFLRVKSTLKHCIKDVKVTRKTYVRASSDRTAFGTVYTDATPQPTATITVDYSSTNGGNISISSNNSHFVPSISSISVQSEKTTTSSSGTTYICGVGGTQTLTVTYTPNPNALGAESAVITIGDLFYTQQITLTATAAKHDNTLAVIGTQNIMVDDVVSNVYTPSSKNSAAPITVSLSREGVITYDPSTNIITAVGAGSATLTISQAENNYHYGVTKTVSVKVSKYGQTISWDNDITDLTLEYGDVLTTNTATASSGMAVTYSSSNTDVLTVDPTTGRMVAVGGGSSVITATQAGNYMISAVSITRRFTVFKREVATVTTSLSESGTNSFPLGSDAITIRANATLTDENFSITGNSEGYVSVSFAENTNTLTISALKEGGPVTVTLTRDQDALYYAIDKTYIIQVVKPVLVLDPTVTPEYTYSEYSSVTLSRDFSSAGYYTIALPFSTTVAALTGRSSADDWVAQLATVTYNAIDGYTLYFSQVADGAIAANQPYVLHLGTALTGNPSWADVTIAAGVATDQFATDGYGSNVTGAVGSSAGWKMTSNFTPGFNMTGLYGIVNSAGGLKRGASNSTLNAFTAYITPAPAAAGVKVQSAFTDEFGNVTIIKGLPADDDTPASSPASKGIYTLGGQRIKQPTHGINVIQGADGRYRKVLY